MLWLLRGRRSGRARFVCKSRQNALLPDGCSCRTGKQAQLTIVALVNPVAQDADCHGIPAGSRACKKQRYEAIKRPWAAVGRRSPWNLLMSEYSLRALPASSNEAGLLVHNDRKEQHRA